MLTCPDGETEITKDYESLVVGAIPAPGTKLRGVMEVLPEVPTVEMFKEEMKEAAYLQVLCILDELAHGVSPVPMLVLLLFQNLSNH